MWSLNKGIIALSTVSAIGAGGAYAIGLFNKTEKQIQKLEPATISSKTIKNRLAKEGFIVLNTDTKGEDWTEVMTALQKDSSGPEDIERELEALRGQCKEIVNAEQSDNYARAKTWCVKREKMNEIIKRSGYTVLVSKGSIISGEQEKWEQKIASWKTTSNKPFKGLEGQIKETPEDTTKNVELFRKECEKLEIDTLYTTDEKFGTNFDIAREWCSFKQNSI